MALSERTLSIVATAKDRVSGVFSSIGKAGDAMGKSITNAQKAISSNTFATQALATATGFSLVGAVNAVNQSLQAAEQRVLSYETGLAKTNTVMRGSADQVKALEGNINTLAKALPVAKQELVDASFEIASAGIASENLAAMLELSAKISIGAMTDVTTGFNGTIAVIKSYGLNLTEATRVADLFFKANELGQTNVGEMAVAIQQVAATANLAGLSLEELFAVYGTLTGVTGNANLVTTQLKSTLLALTAPTEETRKKFDALGIAYGQAALKQKGLVGMSEELYRATGGNITVLKELIPREEALSLITALATTQNGKFKDSMEQLAHSSGSLEAAVAQMGDTTAAKYQLMQTKAQLFGDNAGKVMIFIKSQLIDFAYVMGGVAKTVVGAAGVISSAFGAGLNLANEVLVSFLTNFKTAGREVLMVGQNIAKNIKAAFTGGEMTPLFEGTKLLKNIFHDVMVQELPGVKAGLDLLQQGIKDTSGETLDATAHFYDFKTQMFGTETALGDAGSAMDSMTESTGKGTDAAAELEKEMKRVEEVTKKVEDAYKKTDEAIGEAMEKVKEKTTEALGDLDNKLRDVLQNIANETKDFMQEQADGRMSIADEVIAQEQKIAELEKQIGETDPIKNGDRLTELQAELEKEREALSGHSEDLIGLEAEIAEARRRAGLTEFERNLEDLQKEQDARKLAFDEKITQLQDEFTAIQDQKNKIIALEAGVNETLGNLRLQAAQLYEGILSNMSLATEEEVQNMLDLLESVRTQVGDGSENFDKGLSGILGAGAQNNFDINITISEIPEGTTGSALAQQVVAEITRQVQRELIGST